MNFVQSELILKLRRTELEHKCCYHRETRDIFFLFLQMIYTALQTITYKRYGN